MGAAGNAMKRPGIGILHARNTNAEVFIFDDDEDSKKIIGTGSHGRVILDRDIKKCIKIFDHSKVCKQVRQKALNELEIMK